MDDSTEEWKPVVGYEHWYEVSSYGRVRRNSDGLRRGIKAGHVIKQHPNGSGYPIVCLYNRDTKHSLSKVVHNIVTEAFIGPKPPGLQVNHIDGNKWNAAAANLEYVTGGDNQRHAFCLGLMKKSLNPSLVREIRLYEGKLSSRAVAAIFGIAPPTVQYIWRRVYWSTVEDYDPIDFLNF